MHAVYLCQSSPLYFIHGQLLAFLGTRDDRLKYTVAVCCTEQYLYLGSCVQAKPLTSQTMCMSPNTG